MTIDELIIEGESIYAKRFFTRLGECVPGDEYDQWKRKSLMFLQMTYPQHPQVQTFEQLVAGYNQSNHCRACISILMAFRDIQPKMNSVDYNRILTDIFERFHIVSRQLLRRHENRDTIQLRDEYDVQDLLHALLRLHFEDVRPEEWTPSYSGGANRMDFLLKDEEIAIEVKMTRVGLKDKELGEQLIIDIAKYQNHPNCKCLYCYVYDPEGIIRNPRGMEKDLMEIDKGFPVHVFVRPE